MEINLTPKQHAKLQYECDLLRMSMKHLFILAPHLFEDSQLQTQGCTEPLKPASTVTEEELAEMADICDDLQPPYGYEGSDDYYADT